MNKEKIAYIKHILSSEFVQIDFLDTVLALAVVVICFLAFFTGNPVLFGVAFIVGAVLTLFNMIKCIKKKSSMGVLVFGVLTPTLAFVAFYIFRYIVA